MDTTPNSSAPRRAAIAFIFVTVALDMLALGMIIPILPKLVTGLLEGDAARGAKIYGLFGSVWALMHFLFSPLLGALSDRIGRRPVILLSNLGLGLDYIVMALASNVEWLFIGRVLSGITAASIPAASAYIADVTPPEKRAQGFGILGAAFGLGFILGPALGGLLGGLGPRVPFWIASGLSLANALYGYFILPESHPPERRVPVAFSKVNPLGALSMLKIHHGLLALACAFFVVNLAHGVLPSMFVLYTSYRFHWDEKMMGLTLALVGIGSMLVQGLLVRRVTGWIGEQRGFFVAQCFGACGFVIYGLATDSSAMFLGLPFLSLWGIGGPSIQSLMTQRVPATEQGRLQGVNSSLMGLAELFGPLLFTYSFALAIEGSTLPVGIPFLIAGSLLLLSILIVWLSTRCQSRQSV